MQNLPLAANATDVRQYFRGLSVLEGGVLILGGLKGEVFVTFRYLENILYR